MKHTSMGVAASLLALALVGLTSSAQGRVDFGKSEYESSCASCHGASGKGDGALRQHLVTAPADLTTLAKRNGGVFPSQRVWETIDGRTSAVIGPHGSREMPIWGNVYQSEDTRPHGWYVRNRIASLLDYLARIQEK
jgi:mono/diheme cytochrome c family protein